MKKNYKTTKIIENTNIIDLKSVTIKHPKISPKLSKTIRHARNVFQVGGACQNSASPLYSKTANTDFF